jgi:outer membrane protein assembly factor BamB
MLILENKQLVELSPFGRIVSRQLAVMPAATLPLPPIPQKPGEAASGGNQVLLIMPDGSAAVSRWGAPEISLPPLKGLPLAVEVRGDKAAVALSGGVLTLLSLPGGEALWSNEASSLNEASSFGETRLSGKAESGGVRILYDSRGIYVLSAKGAACFSEDGKRLWSMTIDRAASGPALSRGGYLYSGGEDWILYAYKPENRTAGPEFSLDGSFAEAAYTAEDPRLFFRTEGYFINFDVEEVEARLDFISQKIRSGTIGSDEMEFTAYLMELAGSPGPNPSREALLHPEIRPDHREEALRLLGFLGSRETVPFLAALYSRERDDAIKAAAASAICRIGLDPEGRALRAFTASVLPPVSYRDKRVLSAVIAAAGAVCRTSPPELSEIGVRLLVALGQDGYPVSIQKLARAELSALR